MTIQVSELLEICSYSIGEPMAKEIAKHYELYQDYGRIKSLIVQQMIQNRALSMKREKKVKDLKRQIEDLSQLEIKF